MRLLHAPSARTICACGPSTAPTCIISMYLTRLCAHLLNKALQMHHRHVTRVRVGPFTCTICTCVAHVRVCVFDHRRAPVTGKETLPAMLKVLEEGRAAVSAKDFAAGVQPHDVIIVNAGIQALGQCG